MNEYIDTHCHLDLFQNITSLSQTEDLLPIKTITVTNAPSFFEPNENLFASAQNIRIGLGMHPELSQKYRNEIALFEKLITRTRYIGEIGLDGSDRGNSLEAQKSVLEPILKVIKFVDNKILTVHTRNAAGETIELLNKHLSNTNCKVILHWYTGSKTDLFTAIESGFFFSVNHKMVVSKKGREVISHIPLTRLLTETDAPFTFDNEIKTRIDSLNKTLKGISIIKNIGIDQIKNSVFENFKHLLTSTLK